MEQKPGFFNAALKESNIDLVSSGARQKTEICSQTGCGSSIIFMLTFRPAVQILNSGSASTLDPDFALPVCQNLLGSGLETQLDLHFAGALIFCSPTWKHCNLRPVVALWSKSMRPRGC